MAGGFKDIRYRFDEFGRRVGRDVYIDGQLDHSFDSKPFFNFIDKLADGVRSWWNGATGMGMTQREIDEANMQQQMNLETYNKTQSMQAQMEQYAAAGVNPAAAYMQSGTMAQTGGAEGVSQPSGGVESNPLMPILGLLQGVAGVAGQAAQIENIKADTEGKKIENGYKDEDMQSIIDLRRSQIDLNSENAAHVRIEQVLTQQKVNTEEFKTDMAKWQSKIAQVDAETEKEMRDAMLRYNIAMSAYYEKLPEKVQAEIDHLGVMDESIRKKLPLELRKMEEEIKKIAIEAGLLSKESDAFEQNQFLRYFGFMCQWINCITSTASFKFNVGKNGVGAGGSFAYEMVDNALEEAFASLRQMYGDTGFYASVMGEWNHMKGHMPKNADFVIIPYYGHDWSDDYPGGYDDDGHELPPKGAVH